VEILLEVAVPILLELAPERDQVGDRLAASAGEEIIGPVSRVFLVFLLRFGPNRPPMQPFAT
jgi:hypothetical protein